jgi:hypothetical protein
LLRDVELRLLEDDTFFSRDEGFEEEGFELVLDLEPTTARSLPLEPDVVGGVEPYVPVHAEKTCEPFCPM